MNMQPKKKRKMNEMRENIKECPGMVSQTGLLQLQRQK